MVQGDVGGFREFNISVFYGLIVFIVIG
ncbi:hypothetical protein AB3S75_015689 [Citrus x aurantiifolia]